MTWQRAALLADIPSDAPLPVAIGDESLALYSIGGTIYATSNVCTHEHAWLSDGYLDGDCIECPLHGGLFHVPTGEVRGGPVTEGIRAYPIRIEGAEVFVDLGRTPDDSPP